VCADEVSSAGYRLRSRCLWCREPIGWDCPAGLWVHLRSDGVPCRNLVFAWAAADPQDITITPGPPVCVEWQSLTLPTSPP